MGSGRAVRGGLDEGMLVPSESGFRVGEWSSERERENQTEWAPSFSSSVLLESAWSISGWGEWGEWREWREWRGSCCGGSQSLGGEVG